MSPDQDVLLKKSERKKKARKRSRGPYRKSFRLNVRKK
jgi:hypothetical protein